MNKEHVQRLTKASKITQRINKTLLRSVQEVSFLQCSLNTC